MVKEEYRGLPGTRVTNLGSNVSEWCQRTGEGSTDWDVCSIEIKRLTANPHALDHRLVPTATANDGTPEPPGNEGRGGDVEHPLYSEMDPKDRKCAVCGVDLLDWF